MSEDKMERISALVDGELGSRERNIAIDSIEVDPETRRSWQRYHIIGDTMRNTLPASVRPDLATKLNEMLENEPTILVPKLKRWPKNKFKEFTKPLGGLAIAASVAAMAMIGLQNSEQQTLNPEGGIAEIAANGSQSAPIDENITSSPMAESPIINVIPSTVRTVKYEPVKNTLEAKRLNPYIMNHNQVNSRMGVQWVSPYARLVGHETNR